MIMIQQQLEELTQTRPSNQQDMADRMAEFRI